MSPLESESVEPDWFWVLSVSEVVSVFVESVVGTGSSFFYGFGLRVGKGAITSYIPVTLLTGAKPYIFAPNPISFSPKPIELSL